MSYFKFGVREQYPFQWEPSMKRTFFYRTRYSTIEENEISWFNIVLKINKVTTYV